MQKGRHIAHSRKISGWCLSELTVWTTLKWSMQTNITHFGWNILNLGINTYRTPFLVCCSGLAFIWNLVLHDIIYDITTQWYYLWYHIVWDVYCIKEKRYYTAQTSRNHINGLCTSEHVHDTAYYEASITQLFSWTYYGCWIHNTENNFHNINFNTRMCTDYIYIYIYIYNVIMYLINI